MKTKTLKDVYTIMKGGEGQKNRWVKIGVGFVNKDNSINVVLDTLPLNGRFQIRDRVKREKKEK